MIWPREVDYQPVVYRGLRCCRDARTLRLAPMLSGRVRGAWTLVVAELGCWNPEMD